MKLIVLTGIWITLSWCATAQSKDMDSLVFTLRKNLTENYFQKNKNQHVNSLLIYEGECFNVRIAETLLGLNKREMVLKNPGYNNSFPLSFSVIFRDDIVSLFEPGTFSCYKLSDFTRDDKLETLLNTKRFKYHWSIDNKLYGLSNGVFWFFDSSDTWVKSEIDLPFNKCPKLFEDKEYLVYCDCHGEWGGTVYFYNRNNKNTYFTEATCANSILKADKGYTVLSHLGHMDGSSDLKLIPDPSKLSNLNDFNKNTKSLNALGHADTSKQALTIFNFYGIQIFSEFNWKHRVFYLVNWSGRTFMAEINGKDIRIVDPLFNSDLYTHNPMTYKYEHDVILMNLDFSGLGIKREVSMIVMKGNEIIKIDWNEKH